MQSPQNFKGGALQAIGYAPLVLFIVIILSVYGRFKKDIEDARAYFTRIGADLTARFAALGPQCVELQRKESKEFLDDLTTRDQRMMVAVLTMVITADTKQQLDADTDRIRQLSVQRMWRCPGRKRQCGRGKTCSGVVREINQEYEDKLEQIKAANAHDALEMSGSRAVWCEALAVYAVKTPTDTDDPQEAATVDNNKKALLKGIFWAMNAINSRTETVTTTQTVEADDGEGNIIEEEVEAAVTTLYISVSHKTADEMADEYGFAAEQRQMLAELLAEENSGIWNAARCRGRGDRGGGALAERQRGRRALLVVVRFQLPCGLVRLLCQLVRQRVRVSGRRRDPENGKLRRRLQLV